MHFKSATLALEAKVRGCLFNQVDSWQYFLSICLWYGLLFLPSFWNWLPSAFLDEVQEEILVVQLVIPSPLYERISQSWNQIGCLFSWVWKNGLPRSRKALADIFHGPIPNSLDRKCPFWVSEAVNKPFRRPKIPAFQTQENKRRM